MTFLQTKTSLALVPKHEILYHQDAMNVTKIDGEYDDPHQQDTMSRHWIVKMIVHRNKMHYASKTLQYN